MDQRLIRNFCIISHIDHGKSTLADRFLELTGTIEGRKMRDQYLDMMDLERERGITIKLQPVRMNFTDSNGTKYVLNLIDTPGHADFTYEVSRSLAAVEGAILLVDATQGVQAQTLSNFNLARNQGLVLIPVVNKIDLEHARIDEVTDEVCRLLSVSEDRIIKISAKSGLNVGSLLSEVIAKIPYPSGEPSGKPLRSLIFDYDHDPYKGVVAYVRVVDGSVKAGDKIRFMATGADSEVLEVGVFKPDRVKASVLGAGEIGYIATGLRDLDLCHVGDTVTALGAIGIESLPGYKESKPVVFASLYPNDADDYDKLKDGLSKLKLNDAALQYDLESCDGLGRGFRCGFLGMLHMEIILERLKREYDLGLVVTSPSVSYRISGNGSYEIITSPEDFPENNSGRILEEPWIDLEVVTPSSYIGSIMKLLEDTRGEYVNTHYLSSQRVLIQYKAPLSEVIVNFYDQLKNITSGYASVNYELSGYRQADLVKLDILVAGEKISAFSRIIHKDRVNRDARSLVEKLKNVIPPQLFAVSLQAAIGGKVIARETIKAYCKDVTGYLYGGDYTRKRKLLEKQKKGKKKMRTLGRVHLPQEVFLKVLKK